MTIKATNKIAEAHELILKEILKPSYRYLPSEDKKVLNAYIDVFCFVLECEHNENFEKLVEKLRGENAK